MCVHVRSSLVMSWEINSTVASVPNNTCSSSAEVSESRAENASLLMIRSGSPIGARATAMR